MTAPLYLTLALPTPLRRRFDYLAPQGDPGRWQPGMRIKVPFGRQQLIGVLVEVNTHTELQPKQLREVLEVLDDEPVMPEELLQLCLWAADYYQCPPGEALHTALPVMLRQGEPARISAEPIWQLTAEGKGLPQGALKRAPRQAALLTALQAQPALNRADLALLDIPRTAVKALEDKGLVETKAADQTPAPSNKILAEQALTLNPEQHQALAQIQTEGFQISLLDGATGSGKTEIYLQAIAKTLALGRQALVLVPEIGLTPQTLARFQRRFAQSVVALHSGLNDRERLDAWLMASNGSARIIIGTRSAIFTPLAQPGIIIVDEEHDSSFKQQEGFRYSARDLAAVRARRLNIPLILGSATPSLETLHNAQLGRYLHLHLHQRAGGAQPPKV